ANAGWILLVGAASGSLVLLALGAATLPAETGSPESFDLVGYATGSRIGQLLLARTVLAVVAAGAAFVLGTAGRNRSAIVMALVAVTLVALSGAYQAWIETYDFTSLGTPYSLTLGAKVAVFATALVFGAVNYFDGGRDRGWLGGFRTRIFLEAGFAVAVVGLAANVTSGSPTSEGRPIQISQAVSTAAPGSIDAALGVQPGR